MAEAVRMRDYSLTGEDARLAQEKGLAAASWYSTPLPRKLIPTQPRLTDPFHYPDPGSK